MSLTVAELKAVFSADMASLDRDIVALKRKLSSIRGVTARMDVDTTSANQRIDKMRRNAERNLGTKVTATADTAAAEAKIDTAARDRTSTVRVNVDDAGFKGLSGLMTTIVGLGPLTVPILAAVTGGVTTLGSALAAGAGAGGVFTAAVVGQVKAMVEQQQAITTTQKALDKLAPGTKDYADKLRELHQQQATFNKDFGPAAAGLDHLRTAWSGFLSATKPATVGLIGKSMDTLADVLPVLPPLANEAGRAMSGLLDDVGQWGQSAQARSFLAFFRREGPDAITALGHAGGNFLSGFVSIFQAFAPTERGFLDWLERSSRSFSVWASHLSETDGFRGFLNYLQQEGPKVADLLGQLVTLGSRTLQAFAPLGSIELSAIIDLVGLVNKVPIPILTAAATAFTAWALAIKAVNLSARVLPASLSGVTRPTMSAAQAAEAAAKKTARLQQAARTAAGAGGLLLLMDASNRTEGSLKTLETVAGSALSGFAVGGPLGAGLGAAAGLLAAFTQQSSGASQAQAELETSAKSVADTLDQQTGALTRATDAALRKSLADSGAYDAAEKLGISFDLVTKAASGKKKYIDELTAALKRYREANGINGTNLLVPGSEDQKAYSALTDIIGTQTAAIDKRRHSIDQQNQADGRATGSIVAQGRAIDDGGSALDRHTAATDADVKAMHNEADAAIRALNAHNRLADALLGAVDGQIAFRNAVRDARAGAKGFTGSIFAQTKAADEQLGKLQAVASGWNNLTPKTQKATGAYKGARQTFIEVATSMNVPIDRAKRLADNWLDTANVIDHRKPKPHVDTGAADSALAGLRHGLTSLPDGHVKVNVDTGAAESALLGIHLALDNLPKSRTIKVDTINTVLDRHLISSRPGGKPRAGGGPISGPGGPRDDKAGLFALSNGEYVMPTEKTKRYRPLLDAMRAGVFGMADGGQVGGARADLTSARARHRAYEQAVRALEQLRSGVGTARSNVSEARSNLASRGDVLHQQQQIRDLHQQLASRKKGERLTGLDRRAATQDLKDAQKELRRMQSSDDRLAAAEKRLKNALAAKNAQARKVAKHYGTATHEANRLQAAENRLTKARAAQEAVQQRRQDLSSGLLERSGLFTTGATTAGVALANMRTDLQTGDQWTRLIKQLGHAGLDPALIKQFIAQGPSAQSLALGRSILDSGKISAFNRTQGLLQDQSTQYGRLSAQPGKTEMVHIDNYYAGRQSPDEIAERLWYKTKVRR